MNSKKAYDSVYNRVVKRMIDIVISGAALLILWPFYLIIGFAIAIEDGFPVFYRAPRGGYKNRPFKICKFRSMIKNADKIGGGTTALHDSRITRVGNFLRKTKLDEIPQLGQVFIGKMSLIGPRPELLKYVQSLSQRLTPNDYVKVIEGIVNDREISFYYYDSDNEKLIRVPLFVDNIEKLPLREQSMTKIIKNSFLEGMARAKRR